MSNTWWAAVNTRFGEINIPPPHTSYFFVLTNFNAPIKQYGNYFDNLFGNFYGCYLKMTAWGIY